MKTRMLKWLVGLLVIAPCALASSPPWTGDGVYTFSDTDPFFMESGIFDTATVNIIGGSFGSLDCYNHSIVNMSGGTGSSIGTDDYSVLNLSGGSINYLSAINVLFEPNYSQIHIFAADCTVNLNSQSGYYELAGHWQNDDSFNMLIGEPSWPNVSIHIIPEPCTISLLALGILFLKKRLA